jgi:hypothetical protein
MSASKTLSVPVANPKAKRASCRRSARGRCSDFWGFIGEKNIFAVLPLTRVVGSASAFIFKFEPRPSELRKRAKKEPRIGAEGQLPGAHRLSFEVKSTADLRDALWWLNHAYEIAKN